MDALMPDLTTKKVVIFASLVLLVGFFILPWARNEPLDTFGDNANEIATFAPILWLIPIAALLSGVIAYLVGETSRRTWINWLLILLSGVAILYPHAWITDTFQIRTLTSPALANAAAVGKIYLPWEKNFDIIRTLVNQYHSVLGGEPSPGYGYFISLAADGVMLIFSFGSLLRIASGKRNSGNL
jgi:hypothetical protein